MKLREKLFREFLPYTLTGIGLLWGLFWMWIGFFTGNIDYCPEIAYSYDCDYNWINVASVLTCMLLGITGVITLAVYYDDHG